VPEPWFVTQNVGAVERHQKQFRRTDCDERHRPTTDCYRQTAGQHCTINYTQAGPRVANAVVYTPTHVYPSPTTAPSSTVSATFAVDKSLKMLVAVAVTWSIENDPLVTPVVYTPELKLLVLLMVR
jgi:hypothetical protein